MNKLWTFSFSGGVLGVSPFPGSFCQMVNSQKPFCIGWAYVNTCGFLGLCTVNLSFSIILAKSGWNGQIGDGKWMDFITCNHTPKLVFGIRLLLIGFVFVTCCTSLLIAALTEPTNIQDVFLRHLCSPNSQRH